MATREKKYWLLKSEPVKYPWSQLVKDGTTHWDGVRNYEARNNLRAMRKGELGFFYHSNEGRCIVGVVRVAREAYQDPSTTEDWSVVDVSPVAPLAKPVALDTIRTEKTLAQMALLKRLRLSVTPVTAAEFEHLLALGETKLPKR